MTKTPAFLSKSKYMDGLRCPKLLWYEFNRRKDLPPFNPEVLEIMKQGQIVGGIAQMLFPGGIKIERDFNPNETNRRSVQASRSRKPLFEAGFTYKGCYALADILVPGEDGSWDLIEVKSSSSVKNEHYADVAFQKYVYDGAGIKIRQCYLMHLNRDYVHQGKLAVDRLFKRADISVEVLELIPAVEKMIESLKTMLGDKEPPVKVGKQCPGCLLYKHCWSFLPEENVFLLRGHKKVAFDLMERGILKLVDIPREYSLNDKQSIQVRAHQSGDVHLDKEAIKSFLGELEYPLYFLDFETIAPAVPVYDNTRPFEDIPFQFSVQVVKSKGAKPVHHSYLALGNTDPRADVLKGLKKLLKKTGSIVAYSADYEIKCLRYAVRAYPEYNEWLVELKKRFVDLLIPFKNFFCYYPAQKGSASMKDVLPALTGISYAGMEIANGAMARFEYMRVTFEAGVKEEDKKRVREGLEKYCGQDTLGMVEILKVLEKHVQGK